MMDKSSTNGTHKKKSGGTSEWKPIAVSVTVVTIVVFFSLLVIPGAVVATAPCFINDTPNPPNSVRFQSHSSGKVRVFVGTPPSMQTLQLESISAGVRCGITLFVGPDDDRNFECSTTVQSGRRMAKNACIPSYNGTRGYETLVSSLSRVENVPVFFKRRPTTAIISSEQRKDGVLVLCNGLSLAWGLGNAHHTGDTSSCCDVTCIGHGCRDEMHCDGLSIKYDCIHWRSFAAAFTATSVSFAYAWQSMAGRKSDSEIIKTAWMSNIASLGCIAYSASLTDWSTSIDMFRMSALILLVFLCIIARAVVPLKYTSTETCDMSVVVPCYAALWACGSTDVDTVVNAILAGGAATMCTTISISLGIRAIYRLSIETERWSSSPRKSRRVAAVSITVIISVLASFAMIAFVDTPIAILIGGRGCTTGIVAIAVHVACIIGPSIPMAAIFSHYGVGGR